MKPWIKWTLVSIPILVGGYLIYNEVGKGGKKKDKEKKDSKDETTTTPTTTTTTTTAPTPTGPFPLALGSRGQKVMELQVAILSSGNPKAVQMLGKGQADGKFGTGTEKAVHELLGKNRVDSQKEIDNIKNVIAKKNDEKSQQIENRKFYGKGIIDNFCNRKIRAIKQANIFGYRYDNTKTRVVEKKTYSYKTDNFANPWSEVTGPFGGSKTTCENITSKSLDANGFVIIWAKLNGENWKFTFSPYDFQTY